MQSIADESYEQFTEIVASGRNMDITRVRELADGRIYTARQAADLGLIDGVGTLEEALASLKEEEGIGEEVPAIDFKREYRLSLYDYLSGAEAFVGRMKGEGLGELALRRVSELERIPYPAYYWSGE